MADAVERGHIRIPDSIAERTDVKPAAKMVWAVIRRLQGNDAIAYPAYATIARMAGLSRSKTIEACEELEWANLLEIRVNCGQKSKTGTHRYKSNAFICHMGGTFVPKREKKDRHGNVVRPAMKRAG